MNEEVAAVMVEVVQGEGGVIPADLSFCKRLKHYVISSVPYLL